VVDVACLVYLDPQEFPERMDALEDPVSLVPLDSLDAHHQCARNHHHLHAGPVHLAHRDPPDPPVPQEALAAPDHLAAMETMEPLAHPAHKDPPDPEETQDPTDSQETLVPQLSLSHLSLETQAHRETLAHKDFLETQETLAKTASPEILVPKDPLVHQDHRGHQETMDNQAPADPLDHRENVVCAPNTVPWTVGFSSKMEQDDKCTIELTTKEYPYFIQLSSSDIFCIPVLVSIVAFCTW
jgi:hypothetical protein